MAQKSLNTVNGKADSILKQGMDVDKKIDEIGDKVDALKHGIDVFDFDIFFYNFLLVYIEVLQEIAIGLC